MGKMFWIVFAFLIGIALGGCGTPTDEGLLFATADPNLSIGFRWAAPEPGIDEPEVLPSAECLVIKGNVSASGEKIYHTTDSPNYNQVRIQEEKGEAFFCTVEEAEAAGWRAVR